MHLQFNYGCICISKSIKRENGKPFMTRHFVEAHKNSRAEEKFETGESF